MARDASMLEWQRRLLPLMVMVLLGLAVYACLTSLYQVRSIQEKAAAEEPFNFGPVWASLDGPLAGSLPYAQWKTAVLLESDAMHRRYHQASAITLTRIYIVFLGFMSGMVMALIGAAFILGKLDAPPSTLQGEAQGWKIMLLSSSPGILLVTLGTILMIVTVLSRGEVHVTDSALYLPEIGAAAETSHPPDAASGSDSKKNEILDHARKTAPKP